MADGREGLYCGGVCRDLNRRRALFAAQGLPATLGGGAARGTPARRHPPLVARALDLARADRQLRIDANAAGICIGCHRVTRIGAYPEEEALAGAARGRKP